MLKQACRQIVRTPVTISLGLLILGIGLGYRFLVQYKNTALISTVQTTLASRDTEKIKSDLRAAVLEAVPEMSQAKTDWKRAIILRNHVYSGNKVSLPKGKAAIPLTVENYKAVVSGQSPQLCNGMAIVYIGLLQAFGIPSRQVVVASNKAVSSRLALNSSGQLNAKSSPPDTHAMVEVFLEGRWILQDPTFNIQWEQDGKSLSTFELRQAFLSGKKPTPVTNGYKLLPKRSTQEYYIPYNELLGYIEISELEVINPKTAGKSRVVATMPAGPTWRYAVQLSPLVSSSSKVIGTVVRDWDFVGGFPKTWEALPAAKVSKNPNAQGISVTTDASNGHYQIWSSPEELPPGNYQVRVKGAVLDGGMSIGVLDVTGNTFMTTARYWTGQRDRFPNSNMVTKFSLTEKKPVKIILTNWSYEEDSSIWNVERVMIAKEPSTSPKE